MYKAFCKERSEASGLQWCGDLEIPLELAQKCSAVSLDAGSLLLKIAYMPKQSSQKLATQEVGKEQLKLVTFLVSKLDEALSYIKEHAEIRQREIYITGIGSGLSLETIEKALGTRLVGQGVWQCFVTGFLYLYKHLALSNFLEQGTVDHRPEVATIQMRIENYKKTQSSARNTIFYPDVLAELAEKSHDDIYAMSPLVQRGGDAATAFPCLLAICGASCSFMKIYEDGHYELVDSSTRGGGSFVGIGSLMSDTRSFDELVRMAEEGDARTVDIGMFDFQKVLQEGDMYGNVLSKETTDDVLFSFGKTPGKSLDDFKSKNLVRALLQNKTTDLAHVAVNIALGCQLSDVVFCGGFVRPPLVKSMLSEWFMKKKVGAASCSAKGGDINLHFLKHGSHLGAIGALVASSERK